MNPIDLELIELEAVIIASLMLVQLWMPILEGRG